MQGWKRGVDMSQHRAREETPARSLAVLEGRPWSCLNPSGNYASGTAICFQLPISFMLLKTRDAMIPLFGIQKPCDILPPPPTPTRAFYSLNEFIEWIHSMNSLNEFIEWIHWMNHVLCTLMPKCALRILLCHWSSHWLWSFHWIYLSSEIVLLVYLPISFLAEKQSLLCTHF